MIDGSARLPTVNSDNQLMSVTSTRRIGLAAFKGD